MAPSLCTQRPPADWQQEQRLRGPGHRLPQAEPLVFTSANKAEGRVTPGPCPAARPGNSEVCRKHRRPTGATGQTRLRPDDGRFTHAADIRDTEVCFRPMETRPRAGPRLGVSTRPSPLESWILARSQLPASACPGRRRRGWGPGSPRRHLGVNWSSGSASRSLSNHTTNKKSHGKAWRRGAVLLRFQLVLSVAPGSAGAHGDRAARLWEPEALHEAQRKQGCVQERPCSKSHCGQVQPCLGGRRPFTAAPRHRTSPAEQASSQCHAATGVLPPESGGPRGCVAGSILRWTQTSLGADPKTSSALNAAAHRAAQQDRGWGEG